MIFLSVKLVILLGIVLSNYSSFRTKTDPILLCNDSPGPGSYFPEKYLNAVKKKCKSL